MQEVLLLKVPFSLFVSWFWYECGGKLYYAEGLSLLEVTWQSYKSPVSTGSALCKVKNYLNVGNFLYVRILI
jgi:hypothetical protein